MFKRKTSSIVRFCMVVLVAATAIACDKKDDVAVKKDPVITWANPADIVSGTPLSAMQLNAKADVPGAFVYTPAIGSVLNIAAAQSLKVDFTPTDLINYSAVSKTVKINVTGPALAVGASFQGGIIAYIFKSGDPGFIEGQQHGLIASTNNIGAGTAEWCPLSLTQTATGATGTALGTGKANTLAIIASQGNTGSYAAKMCKDYVVGDYSDWYMPSKDEFHKLYQNKVAIGNFVDNVYWTSSETNTGNAAFQSTASGVQNVGNKANGFYVRAVRSF